MKDVIDCQLCSRLVDHLHQTRIEFPDYHCKPVPAYGDHRARLLVVGLAPGKHGANATGIPFTGDAAGALLYRMLNKFGFSSGDESTADRPAQLKHCRITNAVKCLPPQNRPLQAEINTCNAYLKQELEQMQPGSVVLALGRIAHTAVVRALAQRQVDFPFQHGAVFAASRRFTLIDSYHCSRYNTQTGRLTESMFARVFDHITQLLAGASENVR